MEEDIFKSNIDDKDRKKIEKRLKTAIDIAQERLEYEAAHNDDLLKALLIVKNFIKVKKRVCYGGTAMNMILPPAKRFYNPELDLPDYDFFTSELDSDINALVTRLKSEGFVNVYHKIGLHEGTSKILVNFTPVADITRISEPLFIILQKRAYIREGIYYTDPDILRMMMYLEISRPRGMVSRWEKVYERLQLINSSFPPKALSKHTRKVSRELELVPDFSIQQHALNYCLEMERVIFTGPLEKFYRNVLSRRGDTFKLTKFTGVIGIFSPNVKEESDTIKRYLGEKNVELYFQKAKGEFVPEYAEVRYKTIPVVIILQENSCNSFLSFNTTDGRHINIASLDTLITTWYAISIFTTNMKKRIYGIDRAIPKFIEMVEANRATKNPNLPPFCLNCSGYQKGVPTLLREKMLRKKQIEAKNKPLVPSSN